VVGARQQRGAVNGFAVDGAARNDFTEVSADHRRRCIVRAPKMLVAGRLIAGACRWVETAKKL